MNLTPSRLRLAGAALVALGAIVGSASGLLAIAREAHMSAPWSLPVSLDLVALVAASAVQSRRSDPLAWAGLVAATLISTALQVIDAPPVLSAQVAHAAPPLAALVAFELALRAGHEHNRTPGLSVPPRPAPTPTDPKPAAGKPAKRASKRPAAKKAAVVPSPGLVELVPAARAVAEELASNGDRLSRRNLQAGLEAAGHPVRNSDKAGELLRLVAAEPTDPGPAGAWPGEAEPTDAEPTDSERAGAVR